MRAALTDINEEINKKYAYSKKNAKEYKRGYSNGMDMGCSWIYANTYLLPQEKSLRSILSMVEYDRGFAKGFYNGLKCRQPYSHTFEYDDSISSGISSDNLNWQRVINNIHDSIESYIDAAFENALKSSAFTDIDNTKIHDILRSFTETTGSFLYYLKKELTGYFLKLLVIEISVVHDGKSFENISSAFSSDSVTQLFRNYGINHFMISKHNETDWIGKIIERYLLLLSSDDNRQDIISKSRTSVWRLKSELQRHIDLLSTHSFNEYLEEHQNSSSYNLLQANTNPLTRKFALSEYLVSDFVFMPLYNNFNRIETSLPMSFVPYVGFLIHNFSDKRNIFHHCEEYLKKQSEHITHNKKRDFNNIKNTYLRYSSIADLLLENLECESGVMHSQYICNEFLLNTAILHRQFFSTADSDLFIFLSTSAIKNNKAVPAGDNFFSSDKYSFNYELLRYLHYFDIDLLDLSLNFERRDEFYVDSELYSITEFSEVTDEIKMPLKFILAILKEIYKARGEILQSAISSFLDGCEPTAEKEKTQLNKLSTFVRMFSDEYYSKYNSLSDVQIFNNKDFFSIIADLIYSVGFCKHITCA